MASVPDQFLTTRWSVVLAATGDDSTAQAALDRLCRENWSPLYAFARRWGCSPHDAEDAVQGFMESLLERRSLAGVGPEKGRFRSFLLAGMRNHLSDVAARADAQKRGGGVQHVPLDGEAVEESYLAMAAQMPTPERAFDRVWALGILEKAKAIQFSSRHARNQAMPRTPRSPASLPRGSRPMRGCGSSSSTSTTGSPRRPTRA